MGIKGDVKSISLANVLQDLAMNEKTGTLSIRHKERALHLWFEKGGLRLVGLGSREGPSLLNGLLAQEKIRADEAPVISGKRTTEGGFIRGLVKKSRLTREDLKSALEHQMSEHLCDAFLWTDATFEFEEGEPDDRLFDVDQLDLEPRLAVDAVIMEALRRSDEWGETRKAILSSNEILIPDPQRLPKDAEPTLRRVFGLLDGERSLADIERLTRLGQFVLLRAGAILIRSGAARPVSAAEAFERGRARAAKKEWEAALRMARYGLDHERKNTGLLELALRASEELQTAEAAASYARQLASAQVEAGHLEAAIKSYQRVLVHAPRDLTAHERLFSTFLQLDLKLDALAAGEALASAYKKAGLPDKALAVYQRLVEKLGDHAELLESVAEIQRHLGDKQEAVKLYAQLLRKAMEAKNDAEAIDYCRTILRIDPRHPEALALRQQLESGQIERARKRKRAVRSAILVGVLAALVFGAAVYEYRARQHFLLVRDATFDAIKVQNYREALRLYDTLIDGWRWSVKAREERDMREKIEADFVREALDRVAGLEQHGQLAEAISALEEARTMIRRVDLNGTTQERLRELNRKRVDTEREWDGRLSKMSPKEIGEVRDPLAVPALGKLLGSDKAEVRRAAVAALGSIPGESAVTELMPALADRDPSVATDAVAHLVRRERAPLRALLLPARPRFAPGEAMAVEWRVTNLSPTDVELALEEPPARRLAVAGPNGPLALGGKEAVGRRTVRLGPGEFIGGGFPDLAAQAKLPGRYQLTWSVPVTWNGKSVELRAAPLSLDRTTR
jgi:tetratricopeptide (TPR) repeat protein